MPKIKKIIVLFISILLISSLIGGIAISNEMYKSDIISGKYPRITYGDWAVYKITGVKSWIPSHLRNNSASGIVNGSCPENYKLDLSDKYCHKCPNDMNGIKLQSHKSKIHCYSKCPPGFNYVKNGWCRANDIGIVKCPEDFTKSTRIGGYLGCLSDGKTASPLLKPRRY